MAAVQLRAFRGDFGISGLSPFLGRLWGIGAGLADSAVSPSANSPASSLASQVGPR